MNLELIWQQDHLLGLRFHCQFHIRSCIVRLGECLMLNEELEQMLRHHDELGHVELVRHRDGKLDELEFFGMATKQLMHSLRWLSKQSNVEKIVICSLNSSLIQNEKKKTL